MPEYFAPKSSFHTVWLGSRIDNWLLGTIHAANLGEALFFFCGPYEICGRFEGRKYFAARIALNLRSSHYTNRHTISCPVPWEGGGKVRESSLVFSIPCGSTRYLFHPSHSGNFSHVTHRQFCEFCFRVFACDYGERS